MKTKFFGKAYRFGGLWRMQVYIYILIIYNVVHVHAKHACSLLQEARQHFQGKIHNHWPSVV